MSNSANSEVEVASVVTEASKANPAATDSVNSGDFCKPGSSKDSPTKDNETLKTAMQLLAAGKRNLLVLDLNAAVTALGEASEMLAQLYGETATECAEAYFLYGKALLELARLEAGVIDNGLDGVPTTDDEGETSQVEDPEKCTEEEREAVSKGVDEALEENFVELEKVKAEKQPKPEDPDSSGEGTRSLKQNAENAVVNGNGQHEESEEQNSTEDDDDDEDEAEGGEEAEGETAGDNAEATEGDDEPHAKEDTESIGSNEAGPSAAKDTKDVSAMEAEEEEDPSNLQLAWEMLELAKNIFHKHLESVDADSKIKPELESKLSETYQLLGEVSIENEDYKQAVEDLSTCLKRRQDNLPEDSRDIVATHYQLGVALGFNLQFDEAVNALNDAIRVLEKRIQNLKDGTESKDPTKVNDAFYSREKEIEEIEKLIPEIREKIVDTNDMKEETIKKLGDKRMFEEGMKVDAEAAQVVESTPATEPASNGDKTTSNISHLVKKRKKSGEAENGTTETNGDAKKPHIETEAATTNGHHTNGN